MINLIVICTAITSKGGANKVMESNVEFGGGLFHDPVPLRGARLKSATKALQSFNKITANLRARSCLLLFY